LQGLLDHIRRNGDKATFGTAGSGTTSHLAPGYLLHLAGLKATLVSYRGAGPAMTDLAAGTVDAVIDQTVTMIPAHRGGTAVALAVSAPQRIPQLPDVPSFAEAGLPGFDLVIWNAFAAPAATPAPVIARLAEAIEGAQQDPVLQGRLRDLASTAPAPAARGPEALRQRIAADIAKWTEIIGASGLIWNSGAWVIKGQALPERPSSTGWRAITYRIIFCCHCAWTLLNLAQDREQKTCLWNARFYSLLAWLWWEAFCWAFITAQAGFG
ncbi:MAG: tripartite tricarboxylate transporter substrate-binding protein, partial [Alphaproteobacteria bacterium]